MFRHGVDHGLSSLAGINHGPLKNGHHGLQLLAVQSLLAVLYQLVSSLYIYIYIYKKNLCFQATILNRVPAGGNKGESREQTAFKFILFLIHDENHLVFVNICLNVDIF